MTALLVLMVVWFLFSKHLVIVYNHVVSEEDRIKTNGIFASLILLSIMLWLLIKYTYKPIAFICFLVWVWFGWKKLSAVGEQFMKEVKENK